MAKGPDILTAVLTGDVI